MTAHGGLCGVVLGGAAEPASWCGATHQITQRDAAYQTVYRTVHMAPSTRLFPPLTPICVSPLPPAHTHSSHSYGADRTKLLTLMEFNCLPVVGKVATFGHQYAFARAPAWWVRGGLSGAKYVSEPTSASASAPGPGFAHASQAAAGPAGAAAAAAAASGSGRAAGRLGSRAAGAQRAPVPADSNSGVGEKADEELMQRLLGNPVSPSGAEGGGPSGPSAMFGSGAGAGRAAKGK